jgi:hypothetical protein
LKNPTEVLKNNGVDVPPTWKEVKVVEDSDEVRHMVLPVDDPEYDPGF